MNLRISAAVAAAVGAIALAQAADAAVSFFSFGIGAPSLPLFTNFSGDTVGSPPPPAQGWSGNGLILDTTSTIGAEPAVSPGVPGTGNYLSVLGNHMATLTFAHPVIPDINLYVGSLDAYNNLLFTLSNGTTVNFTGAQLGLVSGADNGHQTAADTNGIFNFTFAAPVKSIQFTSDGRNSFEIASIEAGFVPEPATWAMLIFGLAFAGAALRQRKGVLAAAA